MPGLSKLKKVVDPGTGPRSSLPEIGVHYLNLDFQRSPPLIKFELHLFESTYYYFIIFDTDGDPPKIRSIFPTKQHHVVDDPRGPLPSPILTVQVFKWIEIEIV
jgi:hypothetical protein